MNLRNITFVIVLHAHNSILQEPGWIANLKECIEQMSLTMIREEFRDGFLAKQAQKII